MGLLSALFMRGKPQRGIVDRIKYDGPADVFAWKYPHEDIKLGAQLVVNESQKALLVREGRHLAMMGPGRHTLSTANLPVLGRLASAPFGGVTPFTAEVWFFNMAVDLDVKFGTPTPIQLKEPQYQVIVPIRAHGQMGLRLGDPRQFLRELVGTMGQYTTDQIYNSFRGMVVTKLKTVLGETIIKEKVSVLDIAVLLDPLSQRCREAIRPEFERFGLDVVNLFITDVSFPENDPIVKRLRATVMDRADFEILGDQRYGTKRSFDVMDKAAENPSGAGGTIMGAGLGLGLGAGIGAQAAAVGGALNPNPQQPPTTPPQQAAAGSGDVVARLGKLKQLLDQDLITQQDFDARKADILKEI